MAAAAKSLKTAQPVALEEQVAFQEVLRVFAEATTKRVAAGAPGTRVLEAQAESAATPTADLPGL